MHTPVHPDSILYIFIFLGIVVESLTGTAVSILSSARPDHHGAYKIGCILLAIASLLQALVEIAIFSFVAVVHRRCLRHGKLPRNIHRLCILLYGTSTLVFLLCISRTIERFALYTFYDPGKCREGLCATLAFNEWYLYVFEACPVVIYTLWLNLMHPGTLLPNDQNVYLDLDGKTERIGPGWIDGRSKWETWVDPFDIKGRIKGIPAHETFWLEPERWPKVTDSQAMSITTTQSH